MSQDNDYSLNFDQYLFSGMEFRVDEFGNVYRGPKPSSAAKKLGKLAIIMQGISDVVGGATGMQGHGHHHYWHLAGRPAGARATAGTPRRLPPGLRSPYAVAAVLVGLPFPVRGR
jgi:hypothetical protein